MNAIQLLKKEYKESLYNEKSGKTQEPEVNVFCSPFFASLIYDGLLLEELGRVIVMASDIKENQCTTLRIPFIAFFHIYIKSDIAGYRLELLNNDSTGTN